MQEILLHPFDGNHRYKFWYSGLGLAYHETHEMNVFKCTIILLI